MNAILLVLAVGVTIVVLDPIRVSPFSPSGSAYVVRVPPAAATMLTLAAH